MKKILVISDTHDDIASTRWVLNYLKDTDIDTIIHLGDYYDDASIFEENGYELIRVPGTWDHRYYRDPLINNRKFIEFEGWKLFLTHTPESHYNDIDYDLKPENIIDNCDAEIFLCGHTHLAKVKRTNGVIIINPGHMSRDENRGCPLTYALLEIEKHLLTVSIMKLFDNKPYLQRKFEKLPEK